MKKIGKWRNCCTLFKKKEGKLELFKTEQEKFWAGEFGDEYISRNRSSELLASNLDFFSKALKSSSNISSCLEFGANIGMNLKALKLLYPNMDQYALEINKKAVSILSETVDNKNIFNESILEFEAKRKWDLVVVKGVLIHLNPDYINDVYKTLVSATSRYLLICEYYNPQPVMIKYRGKNDKLYKRDFAGEILDSFSNVRLADYGFAYHKDVSFPQDDITWFLLEKMK